MHSSGSDRRTNDTRRATCSLAKDEAEGKVKRIWSWNLSLKELVAFVGVKTMISVAIFLLVVGYGARGYVARAVAEAGAPHMQKAESEHSALADKISFVDQKATARREALEKRLDADELLMRVESSQFKEILDKLQKLESQMTRMNALHENKYRDYASPSSQLNMKPLKLR